MVEHHLAKVGVAGSNPVVRSRKSTSELRFLLRVSSQSSYMHGICTELSFASKALAWGSQAILASAIAVVVLYVGIATPLLLGRKRH